VPVASDAFGVLTIAIDVLLVLGIAAGGYALFRRFRSEGDDEPRTPGG
jgi:hypothetical protein